MAIRDEAWCWRLLMKHKQINGVPLYTAWILGSVCVCVYVWGPGGRPGNQSCNSNPFGIWHFYHRGVNTVGRLEERWSTLPRPASPRGPTLAGHTQRTQCPQTQWHAEVNLHPQWLWFQDLNFSPNLPLWSHDPTSGPGSKHLQISCIFLFIIHVHLHITFH